MKSAHNPQLDDILLNLMNSRQYRKPKWKVALKYRQLKASTGLQYKNTHKSSNSLFDLSQYQKYGTGVTLYFSILQFLIITFSILSINAIPSLICNLKGNGLDIYSDGGFTNTLMKVSLANQNRHKLQTLIISPHTLKDMRVSQSIVIFSDILSSLIFLCFLIYWQIKSDRLICQLLSENVLPSYYTVIVSQIPSDSYSQQSLKMHFSKFGEVVQISTVYDLSTFMVKIQQFIKLVDLYATSDPLNRQKMYFLLENKYLDIKNTFNTQTNQIKPVCVFVTFNYLSTRNQVQTLYKYQINQQLLLYENQMLQVERCKVQPSSIIWQNFHLRFTAQRKKSLVIYLVLVLVLLGALISFFLINVQSSNFQYTSQQIHIDPSKNYTYEQVLQTQSKDILFNFCSKLQAFTFQWKYYVLCIPYYETYQEKIVVMLTFSLLIVAINYILNLIIYALGQFRRYKTKTEKGSFLIINTFIVYFINTGLLILLIRADFDGYSLSRFMQSILPSQLASNIQAYKDFNRKWYFHIGSQIIFNYAISLIISPFCQILLGWGYMKIRFFLARWAKTQKQMNEMLVDSEFDFQTYYAMLLNSVFYCLFYANAIPILYIFAIFSMLSIYIASVIIFKYFSCKPAMFDHTLNKIISKILIIALLMHQLTSIMFYFVDDIFPYDGDHRYTLLHKFKEGRIYIFFIIVLLLFLIFHDQIAKWVKKHWNKRFKQRISIESIKTQSQLQFKDLFLNPTRKTTYLSSYRMEDNPIYFNLSYTLSIFKIIINKAIIEAEADKLNQNNDEQEQIRQSSKYIYVSEKFIQRNEFL